MKNLESILKNYEADIECWSDDFGEGHLFLDNREQLIPYEDNFRVKLLDKRALEVIRKDNSKGSDRLFLKEIENIIYSAGCKEKVA